MLDQNWRSGHWELLTPMGFPLWSHSLGKVSLHIEVTCTLSGLSLTGLVKLYASYLSHEIVLQIQ